MSFPFPQSVDCLVVGCGYLGARVAAAWRTAGYSVAVTTRSAEKAQQWAAAGYQPILANVLQPETLQQLPATRVVLHAVGYDRQSGQSMRDVYVQGLTHLLTAVQGRCERLIHISSTSVYGQTNGEEVDETSPAEPDRENGQIVREAEQLVEQSPLNYVILRLAGIYGPDRLIARIAQRQDNLPIPGNPEAWLNLIHVEDCVQAVLAAADAPLSRETILVSDDRPVHRREYYETLARLLQAPAPVFSPEQADPKGDRGQNKRCRNTKLKATLLPELRYPTIEQGLPAALR